MDTPLVAASGKGHLDVVNRLLDCKKINVNVKSLVSRNVWILSPCTSQISLSKVLGFFYFCHDIWIVQNGDTALIAASKNGNLDVVNRLLDCKEIDVNLQKEHWSSVKKKKTRINFLNLSFSELHPMSFFQ